MNPIENLWHELKEFIRREVKPKTKEELVQGIERFWSKVDVEKCNKYINHLNKVIPRVIEMEGLATGYNHPLTNHIISELHCVYIVHKSVSF